MIRNKGLRPSRFSFAPFVNKIKELCLFLLIAVTIGIHPALALDAKTLDLGLASDDELTEALNKANDIELVNNEPINKEDNLTADSGIAEETQVRQEAVGGSGGNEYLEESRRLAKLAEEAFSEADYDKSARLANEAAWLAMQSDVNVAIAEAKRRLDQAVASGVSARFPQEYREAENWYKQSAIARDGEEWDIAVNAANMAVKLLEGMDASIGKISSPAVSPVVSPAASPAALPATYTVRPWSVSKDCFWNIAGFPWVYGNPHQWRLLYNANKSKLPNPNNPNVIEPGTVLDIPSIKGELRQGAWESGRTYEALR